MGSNCTKGDSDENIIRPRFTIGKEYQELPNQFTGEGVLKTISWKATITRQQLEAKRIEFWRTRSTGRRHIWLAIKSAIESDPATAKLLLEMNEIKLKNDSITHCEDAHGTIYDIPPYIVNDPIYFPNEKKVMVPKPSLIENELITLKIRRTGKEHDTEIQIETKNLSRVLKEIYAEKDGLDPETLRLFFSGKELKDDQALSSYYVRNEMVVQAFVRAS
ncbi:unnamed protein product [Blepharisma stoltei]|uniref:Ubiquitin-like domain-containing protein n=1 Tax=Blepharisma stoltei TaxID=1481888 RepID=A0AAU9ILP0_9CILI|nr:unnamed protein product [Blepharisma stoltei]